MEVLEGIKRDILEGDDDVANVSIFDNGKLEFDIENSCKYLGINNSGVNYSTVYLLEPDNDYKNMICKSLNSKLMNDSVKKIICLKDYIVISYDESRYFYVRDDNILVELIRNINNAISTTGIIGKVYNLYKVLTCKKRNIYYTAYAG